MKNDDMAGQRFSRLLVLKDKTSIKHSAYMCLCVCDCGVTKEYSRSNVRLGKSKSCGCLAREKTSEVSRTHGMSKAAVYGVWNRMWSRCTNPTVDRFHRYGGRGIMVCERWAKFENFLADMGDLPSPEHSIGRIDNDGNYEPSNCRWETKAEQQNNTSRSVFIEWIGERKTVTEWAKVLGIPYSTLSQRISAGMPIEKAMCSNPDGLVKKYIEVDGVSKTTTQWMADLSIPISSFYHFKRKGLTDVEVIRRYTAKYTALARELEKQIS